MAQSREKEFMRRVRYLVVVSAVAVCGYFIAEQTLGTSQVEPEDRVEMATPAIQQQMPHGAMGMTAVLDESGERFVQQPIDDPNGGLDPAIVDTSTEGLEIEQDPQGRGFYMNLQGRFQSAIVATIDDQGNLKTDCVPTVPAEMNGHGHAHGHAQKGGTQ